jgi:hypothetical protein
MCLQWLRRTCLRSHKPAVALCLSLLPITGCVPPVELKVQAADAEPSGQDVPTCDVEGSITVTVEAPHCAVEGFVVNLEIGTGADKFWHLHQFGGKLDRGGTIALTLPLEFRDAFRGDNVDVTVTSTCADGRKARGAFRCRAAGTKRPLPT